MADRDYEELLIGRGYDLSPTQALEPVRAAGLPSGFREAAVTGRRQRGDTVIEVQLQRVRSANSRSLAGVARITRPGLSGDGLLLARPLYGVFKTLTSGPTVAVVVLMIALALGVWAIMAPGVFLVWLVAKSARASSGLKEWSDLISPLAVSRYAVWGRDHDAARAALPASLQEALIKAKWFGAVGVQQGALTLDRPIGYGRTDLFKALLDAVDAVGDVRAP